jgi:hypothetical protein
MRRSGAPTAIARPPACAERDRLAPSLPAAVVLYERIRAASAGVGAAALLRRRCEGCHLELSGADLRAVANRTGRRGGALRGMPAHPGPHEGLGRVTDSGG